jgi:hypothetical protein
LVKTTRKIPSCTNPKQNKIIDATKMMGEIKKLKKCIGSPNGLFGLNFIW